MRYYFPSIFLLSSIVSSEPLLATSVAQSNDFLNSNERKLQNISSGDRYIHEVKIEPLPAELKNPRLRISLPGLNIVECDGEGSTVKLQEPINIEAVETKTWSQYPYFDLTGNYGYQENQTSFGMRGVMIFDKLMDDAGGSMVSLETVLIDGPLFHSKMVTKESLKFSQFRYSVHYEDISEASKIVISVAKNSTLNRYIFITQII